MKTGITTLACIPIRSEASEKSEMVTQLLFGEKYYVFEQGQKFSKIKILSDDYEGWISNEMISLIDNNEFHIEEGTSRVSTCIFNQIRNKTNNSSLIIPGASTIRNYDELYHSFIINNIPFVLDDKCQFDSWQNAYELARLYLGSPYLWGGRTFLGIDCSGLVQNVFKMKGIQMPRDASQQIRKGTAIEKLSLVQKGDLAFFHNHEGKIVHVGILDGNGSIIHSSGYVKIELISEEGIIKKETGEISHHLNSIKRIGGN